MQEFDLIFFVIGAFGSFLLDTYWWVKPSFSKYEKGVLVNHEHYHFGLELIIVAIALIFVSKEFSIPLSIVWSALVGAGFGFIIAEWRQIVETHRGEVTMGHPFAYGSKHFKESTQIGVVIFAILVIFLAYVMVT
ncbi:hypothetical protein C5F49_08865 [Nitrosopumilus oxyclinae]|uniref:Uncharacterized protein n=1 Tax=Nitrosopumilus oxyclinae TaxID=1959104 RepID=A0A7D5RBN2_9ARCH|nr:hypothetical protein [Nitrosopumilus oxyclinae]QLH05421.1 hypothetical protein C5F49_08865 [Nitrosopumilus oxyclinae]